MHASPWLLPTTTALILFAYLLYIGRARRIAWRTHAALRDEWFDAISHQPGSEILAVQTLRNSVMTATMMASTAALGLMGAVSLVAGTWTLQAPRAMALLVMVFLLAALIASTMAIRYYHHVGFICAMPVGSTPRTRWTSTGRAHLRTAGALYSVGLRCLVLVTPLLVALVYTPAGPVAALAVVAALLSLERLNMPGDNTPTR